MGVTVGKTVFLGRKALKKRDPAVEWLSSLVAPLSPREFLLQQARELLVKSGQLEPPFEPQKALPPSVKGVEKAKISRDGMLVPVEQGFIIKLNSQRPKVRQRFACAHEIGHTFFFDWAGGRPWRPYESLSSYWAEEDLCYEFAEEMLMPQETLEKLIGMIGPPCINNFEGLLNTFQVSSEALTRRIQRLNIWESIMVILIKDDQSSNFLKRRLVRKHKSYKYFRIQWDKLLTKNSSPYIAFRQPGVVKKSVIKAEELFRGGKKNKNWSIESCRFNAKNSAIVVSIITPSEST
ncbi:hypothetical protein ES703_32560 [subsurface metagenome]